MTEIIRKWIGKRLGIILDNDVVTFGQLIKDGNLISQLLCNYGLLHNDDICPTSDDFEVCYTNLICLTDPLKSIGIDLSDAKIQTLAIGDGNTAYKFFYQLYLTLHDKSKIDFILNAKLNEKPEITVDLIEDIGQKAPTTTPIEPPNYDSTKTLYQWHKKNYLDLVEQNKLTRENYIEKFQTQIKTDELNPEEIDAKNANDIEIRLNEMFHNVANIEFVEEEQIEKPKDYARIKPSALEARQYIINLKEKNRKAEENKILQTYMHKMLLSDLQTKFKNKQDKYYNEMISEKLLKQSVYEKQMTTKLLEVHNQKDRIVENRQMMHSLMTKQLDERFVGELYKMKHNVTLASLKNYNERQRVLDLHRKLYQQKMERKFLRHYNICYKIMTDLTNLAIKVTEYETSYAVNVPEHLWRDWVCLFVNEEKLLDTLINIEEVLSDVDEEECSEMFRQNHLDDKDLYNYLHLHDIWFIEDLEAVYFACAEPMKLGLNILAHIIYKLFFIKYPKPSLPICPTLPTVFTACSIIGLNHDTQIKILQRILLKRKIIVVNEQEVANFCLEAFQKESNRDDIDKKLDKETTKATKASKKPDKKKPNPQDKKGRKLSQQIDGSIKLPQSIPKETQTPKLFPDEEVKLSPAAQLGQNAYDILNLGLPINNYLFTKMFIEFIKSFKTIRGWVLVNYPMNCADAVALELALTGRDVKNIAAPILEAAIEEENCEQEGSYVSESYHRSASDIFAPPEDIYVNKRVSKLLPPYVPPPDSDVYHSYLNSFIRVINVKQDYQSRTNLKQSFEMNDDFAAVEQFYETLHCKNTLTYKEFNADTVKEIVNLVMQDNIFGLLIYNEIIQVVFDVVEEKRRLDDEISLKQSKSFGKKKGKPKKGIEKEPPKKPKSIIIVIPETPVVVEVPSRPGDVHWTYVDLPLAYEFQKQLVSFWEDIELAYVNDFKQIFFQFRICKNSLVPYSHAVYSHMSEFIQRPDDKQDYLHKFQMAYNDLENDFRDDEEFKTELHCRVLDFKTRLWDICVCRMRESEEERQRIINENWFCELAVEIVNLFISAMQLELDRYCNTMQLIVDYYTFMVTQELSVTKYNKLSLLTYHIDEKLINFTSEAYTSVTSKITNTPFTVYVGTILKNCLQFINQMYQIALASMKIMEKLIVDSKPPKSKPLAAKTSAQEPGDLQSTKNNMIALNTEWQYANDGEFSRSKYRLHLLEARACLELDEIVLQGEKMFHEIYDDLDKRNQDELQSVNLACEIFHRATEACESVQPRLLIVDAKFFMDGEEIMYNDIYQPMIPYLDETTMDIFFSIPQLLKLTDIFLDLAPNGSLPFKTFSYLVEDMVTHQSDNGFNILLPLYWHNLETAQVQDVLFKIYGNIEYINWKNFIVYILEIPFPSEQELLDVREQFRSMDPDKLEYVNQVQFNRVEFWFDKTPFVRQTYTKANLKKLLSKMFEIREDCINYSALLLTFCKDFDPIIGVAKAFGLCVGKLVCWNVEIGANYVEILRYQKFLEQEKLGSNPSELESHSNCSETKFPSNADFPKENYETLSEDVESFFMEAESMEGEEYPSVSPPSLCYVLPFNIILTIMTAALPWHIRVQCVQDKSLKEFLEVIYEDSRNEEFQLVFTHDFLNNEAFKNYITTNYKFNVRSPASFVQMKIEKCFCKKETLTESN